jgi:HSP20 family protein
MNTTMTNTSEQSNRTDESRLSNVGDVGQQTYQTTFAPRFDIWEGDDELILYGDLPGVEPDSLDIQFENRQLTIHGRVAQRQQGMNYLYSEYATGDFHRSFAIGEAIDSDGISAELHDGVLTLHLPKSESVKPRRIQVKTG